MHSERHVRRLLDGVGLEILACDQEIMRMESGEPVPGMIIEARKPAATSMREQIYRH